MTKRIANLENDAGNMSKASKDEFVKKFEQRAKQLKNCEICDKNVWSINDRIVSPVMLDVDLKTEDRLSLDFRVSHPCAFLQCTNCGNSKFISLAVIDFDPYENRDD